MLANNIKKIIDNSYLRQNFAHCYIFKGNNNKSIDEAVLYFVNTLMQSKFVDLKVDQPINVKIFNDGEDSIQLTKEKIIEIFESSAYSALEDNSPKIIILKNVEEASPQALNALLKTIEEPSPNVYFLLTTKKLSQVLKTIKSRSLVLNIPDVNDDSIKNILNAEGFNRTQIWLYSSVFRDIDDIKLAHNFDFWNLFNLTLEAIKKSIENKYNLAIFLHKYAKKDSEKTFEYICRIIQFIASWYWLSKKQIETDFLDDFNYIKKLKINYLGWYKATDNYLSNLNELFNQFLQMQNLIIELMENYV